MTDGYTFTIKNVKRSSINPLNENVDWNVPGKFLSELVDVPYVVPNGMWALDRGVADGAGLWAWLVGVDDYNELESVTLESDFGWRRTLYISDKPFGFVDVEERDVDKSTQTVMSSGRKTLDCARQVHKGELSRGVDTPKLNYVRQPFATHEKPNTTNLRERRRGQYGWVNLPDLGDLTVGFSSHDQVRLVLGYWQFSGHLHYESFQRIGTLVDVIVGSADDIRSGDVEVQPMTADEFRCASALHTGEIWIRRGFAFTILRLQALGVKPTILQNA